MVGGGGGVHGGGVRGGGKERGGIKYAFLESQERPPDFSFDANKSFLPPMMWKLYFVHSTDFCILSKICAKSLKLSSHSKSKIIVHKMCKKILFV